MFLKIGVSKNFTNFTEKQLFWSHFLIKLQFYQKETLTQEFSCEISETFSEHLFLQNPFAMLLKKTFRKIATSADIFLNIS